MLTEALPLFSITYFNFRQFAIGKSFNAGIPGSWNLLNLAHKQATKNVKNTWCSEILKHGIYDIFDRTEARDLVVSFVNWLQNNRMDTYEKANNPFNGN